jgi:hypothetical protein
MIYALFKGTRFVTISTESPYNGTPELKYFPGVDYDRAESRHDWASYEEVQALAMFVTVTEGTDYIGIDNGNHVSPRFDIIEPPKINDEVSYAFNGDCYPCGTIERITKGGMVITSTGKRFNRRKLSGAWIMVGGTWSLVQGHHSEQNPSF